ncbi:MAG TPA: hypothetical protein PKD32_05215 [Saprospiraceae bacterium]|nr:hypothetical protein [Saprospiraceae bacterium]
MNKAIYFLFLQLYFCIVGFSQIPKLISYQAVITNNDGSAYRNKNVSFKFAIQRFGNDVYTEQHDNIITSPLGQVNLNIGQGNRLSGDYNAIDWADGAYSVRTDIRLEGNSFFELYSNTDFKSVPYALQAEKAKNGVNKMVFQNWDNRLVINDNISVDLSPLKSGSQNYVAGNGININGNQIEARDPDPQNELQQINLSGNRLSLSQNGGEVTLPTGQSYTQGSGITISGNQISANDNSPNNEIQSLSLDAAQRKLSISNGNTVDFTPILGGGNLWRQDASNIYFNTGNVGIGVLNNTQYKLLVEGSPNNKGIQTNGEISFITNTSAKPEMILRNGAIQRRNNNANSYLELNPDGGRVSIGKYNLPDNKFPVNAYVTGLVDGGLLVTSGGGSNVYGGLFKTTIGGQMNISDRVRIECLDNYSSVNRFLMVDNGPNANFYNNNNIELISGATNGSTNVTPSIMMRYQGKAIADIQVQSTGSGLSASRSGAFRAYNSDGNEALYLGTTTRNNINTVPQVLGYNKYNGQGTPSTAFNLKADDSGGLFELSKSGGKIVSILKTDNNGGRLEIFSNTSTTSRGALWINAAGDAVLSAQIKNFVIQHPKDNSSVITYASIEGPEAGAYDRGIYTLVNGEAFIKYSEVFGLVINPNTVTITLTPHSVETFGLAVVEKTSEGFRVKELKGGKGNFTFDWEVKGVRKGYENYKDVQLKSDYFGLSKN